MTRRRFDRKQYLAIRRTPAEPTPRGYAEGRLPRPLGATQEATPCCP